MSTDAKLKFAPKFVISTLYVAERLRPAARYFGTFSWVHSALGLYCIVLSVMEPAAPGCSLVTATVKRPCCQSSLPYIINPTASLIVNLSAAFSVLVVMQG